MVPVWLEWVSAGQFGQLKPVEIALGGLHICSELPALGTPTPCVISMLRVHTNFTIEESSWPAGKPLD